jgi:hypothetical protein
MNRQRAAGICWKAAGGSDKPPTKQQLEQARECASGDAAAVTKSALATLRTLRPFADSLPGSPLYMAKKRQDALSWIASGVGTPFGIFLTLGTGAPFWAELFSMMGLDPATLTRGERERLLRENPLVAVQHFHDRLDAFRRHILNGRAKPFGDIVESLERDDATQLPALPHPAGHTPAGLQVAAGPPGSCTLGAVRGARDAPGVRRR